MFHVKQNNMYNQKDIQFEGKHDFKRITSSLGYETKSMSVGIFKLLLRAGGKSLKESKAIVRVHGRPDNLDKINEMAEIVVKHLDCGNWDGRYNVYVKQNEKM